MSIYDSSSIMIFFIIIAACLGAVLGSFLNCAAWRIVRGESFTKGRSHCPICGHTLTALELIPVISWVLQKGRCKSCHTKISTRYPLTELACALMTVLCLLRFDLTVLCLRNYIFLCCLFLLTLTDLEEMIIPDGCHIIAVLAWIAALPFLFTGWTDVLLSVVSGVVFGGGLLGISLIMDKIMGRDTLGGGDIKLFAVTGLYLGLVGTLFTVVFACIIGLFVHVLQNKKDNDPEKEKAFPFGPSIAIAAGVMLLYGEPLINWYKGLLSIT